MLGIPKRRIKRITSTTLKVLLGIFVVVFIIGPLIYKYTYKLQEAFVFVNFVNFPKVNYSNPSALGIERLRNFHIQSDENVKLGVWQILPDNLPNNSMTEDYFETVLNNGQHVVIYYHGNAGNRAASHRIELYQVLRKDFHVIAFDYRSFGDSTNVPPTEDTVVKDCIAVYNWVTNRTSSKVFIWGHSLGTGLSLHMLSVLSTKNITPTGLILESPFSNLREAITNYPLAVVFRFLPWFQYTIVEPMQDNNFVFANDKHILNVDCPILILHAEDDAIVPHKLGLKLYNTALKYRKPSQGSIQLFTFSKYLGYGHKYICRAPNLPEIVKEFMSKAIEESI